MELGVRNRPRGARGRERGRVRRLRDRRPLLGLRAALRRVVGRRRRPGVGPGRAHGQRALARDRRSLRRVGGVQPLRLVARAGAGRRWGRTGRARRRWAARVEPARRVGPGARGELVDGRRPRRRRVRGRGAGEGLGRRARGPPRGPRRRGRRRDGRRTGGAPPERAHRLHRRLGRPRPPPRPSPGLGRGGPAPQRRRRGRRARHDPGRTTRRRRAPAGPGRGPRVLRRDGREALVPHRAIDFPARRVARAAPRPRRRRCSGGRGGRAAGLDAQPLALRVPAHRQGRGPLGRDRRVDPRHRRRAGRANASARRSPRRSTRTATASRTSSSARPGTRRSSACSPTRVGSGSTRARPARCSPRWRAALRRTASARRLPDPATSTETAWATGATSRAVRVGWSPARG